MSRSRTCSSALTTSLLGAGLLSAGAAPGFAGVGMPAALAFRIGTLLMAIILHELAHGWVANRLGDPTACDQGRLTLNALPHLDLFGSLVIPGFLLLTGSPFILGWAKPMPIDIRRFCETLRDFAIAALAGPVANFVQLAVYAVLFRVAVVGGWPIWVVYLTFSGAAINLLLGLFNLISISPLDGSRIVAAWLPPHLAVRE